MKIFSAAQIRQHDLHTMKEQGISSEALMERAAEGCTGIITELYPSGSFIIFCGKGNNGGDGMAIARLLREKNRISRVFILESGSKGSNDFEHNLARIANHDIPIHSIKGREDFPAVMPQEIIIDALFGTGLNKPLSGLAAELVEHINTRQSPIVAIDMPSGLFCDSSSKGQSVIFAAHTLSFSHKLAFMMAENENCTGIIHEVDIGLSESFEASEPSNLIITRREDIRSMIRKRPLFAHKGTFGHGAIAAGSHGMMGAAILAATAFLRSGAGKLTCYVPECGYEIMQTAVPEAMCETSGKDSLLPLVMKSKYEAIGAGPGIGLIAAVPAFISPLLEAPAPLVLDADLLNGIAANKELLDRLPPQTIITPHPGEFERIFGKTENDFARLELASASAGKYGIFIILKGHNTAICFPDGRIFFNTTGNPGMAKPGMGDVLTGLLTGLLAQSHPPGEACILGVFIHGRAGDLTAEKHTQQAMTALQVAYELEEVWKEFN